MKDIAFYFMYVNYARKGPVSMYNRINGVTLNVL